MRLIGIDTPESVSESVPVECFGPEAKHRTAELLPAGTAVVLERDVEARIATTGSSPTSPEPTTDCS